MTGGAALDNCVWPALDGPQADLAERVGRAARFHPDLSPFAALADPSDPACWADLARLAGAGGEVVLFAAPFEVPAGWDEVWQGKGLQMVAAGPRLPPRSAAAPIVDLTADDAEDMAALVAATEPGPWRARTHELGPFVGVRDGARLIAMAGTRLHPPGHREISAVCTAADHRGRGLAGALVSQVAAGIAAAGDTPILHVAAHNAGAIRLYEALGFEPRRHVTYGVWRAPPVS